MNRWGMGTTLYRATILYGLLAVLYDTVLLAAWCDRLVPWRLALAGGGTLLFLGLVVYALGTFSVYKAVDAGQLATRGIYAVVRHPLYAAWVWLIVPGLALLQGTPLTLAAPVVAAVFYRLCIPHEEAVLSAAHGEAYEAYRRRVGGIVPRLGRAAGPGPAKAGGS
ncbi:Isoprenylcysteine carboxyl methyltransferase [Solidesulfovibrio carbinoliphilus subsp. oakridgensis]|uniref:Isoprenylcysteine carboxyl methyltransferase n=1 Tax=Solidesulfovibrio carbinoliphilus subsp. oakridgensis TaxID=694327 RepID=G7Q988_9BACT|nr:isoprenylcysteine carboxylmethyltransferase family protein [Solidesulfovibrio carbinoliphilus]EHJ48131.1 Isoprenylcysteine carboxyl methyltransferase [Solidesulfovibrio carbinoliphilus subsp. oakridgensis]